ncbi:T9SS type A sorting domain-containing protein [Fodinibius sp.]|uniref:T9SS-dependent M6-like inactivated metalloprotease n=1 Tax=Fodinibius sp. TaxID=1872440 RepID=UPI002ACDE674|nr:T9SS type A sorting domain-containing protein [Fodinibius sp.]MDZ7660694.1 T9SS type A sorting domain-containing protein [Fodinibius sp.]
MLLLFGLHNVYGQQFEIQRSHSLTPHANSKPSVPDTLTVIAIMVEFQPDENRLTTGNGTFNPSNLAYLDNPDITIDPLPHNQSYFERHLTFAQNYFKKVSGDQLHIKFRVLSTVYQLQEKMERYSPTGESFTDEKVADLAQDAWQVVEEQGGFSTSDLDPQKTAFAIFHAGIGRDIELTGTILDKTPQDIPSLFLDQSTLSNLLERPNFDGFPINNGAFRITNSMILPRSLSRRGEDITGNEFVLQLSTNGLICASIGSYLGLPDLFNTETGNSGIGRFGLMDGESFFSYRGLFPPEPSAWEKIYLGWQDPFNVVPSNNNPVILPAAAYHQQNSIAKVPLSADEYFLIENRHRDPNSDGVTLTFEQPDGTVQTKQFSNYDESFINQTEGFEESLMAGVVTDVNNPEWSLPGGLDPGPDETRGTADDRLLNGGILIWHIDEAVINSQIANQSVNNNPDRRGVDLEEADGAQDIGRAANSDFSSQARGTAFDFWWDGNNASVVTLDGDTLQFYENRFGPDTRPSNESNSGAPSFFELYDFSDNQPVASFRIRSTSSNNIQSVNLPVSNIEDETSFTTSQSDYFSAYPLGLTFYSTSSDSFLIIPTQQSTYAVNLGNTNNPVFDFQSPSVQQPYLGNALILGKAPTQFQIELSAWQWNGNQWNAQWNNTIDANDAFLSSNDSQTLYADFTDQRINISDGTEQQPLPNPQQRSTTVNGRYTVLTESQLTLEPDGSTYPINKNGSRHYSGAVQLEDERQGFYYLSENKLLVFDPESFNQPHTIVQNIDLGWPAMADLNSDGRIDFSYVNQKTGTLEARNINGALLANFPITAPQNARFIGTPLITHSEQTGDLTLYIPTQDSLSLNINAYTVDGEPVEGFPLYVGNISDQNNQPIHPLIHQNTLYAVSHRGDIKAWQLDNIDEVLWASRYGNTFMNKVSGTISTENPQEPSPTNGILVKEETYNWPNPAEDFTNIRFQTSGPGTVEVKIITSGGRIIFDKNYEANGGPPEEYQISTHDWSSGLYFAMITATVDGQKEQKMIKIVIVQ